jgi:ribosome-associated toxin RatA of RatAB toxin-antitoxin module
VHDEDDELQHATLTVSVAGIEQRFSTVNRLEPGRRLGLALEQGPFRSLSGEWRFQQLGEAGSKILLVLEFDFGPGLISSAFQSGFKHIADRLVQDFCKRAEAIYGQPDAGGPDGR